MDPTSYSRPDEMIFINNPLLHVIKLNKDWKNCELVDSNTYCFAKPASGTSFEDILAVIVLNGLR